MNNIHRPNRFCIPLLLFMLCFGRIYSQSALRFTTKIEKDGKTHGGASVVITQNGKPFTTIVTNDDGKVSVELPAGFKYLVTISKPQMCTKKLEISTVGMPPDAQQQTFDIKAITVFELQKGIDYSVLNQVLVKANYDATSGSIEYDEAYANQMLDALNRLKEVEKEAIAKAKELAANYQNAIKAGDKAYQKKGWDEAISNYNQAVQLKPEENYPKEQIALIEKMKADEAAKAEAEAEAKAKAEAEAKAKAEAEAKAKAEAEKLAAEKAVREKAELDTRYNAAIKKADVAFEKKDWLNARAGYNEALGIKANESYPKNQLNAIDKAEAEAKAKAEAEAKAKAEAKAEADAEAKAKAEKLAAEKAAKEKAEAEKLAAEKAAKEKEDADAKAKAALEAAKKKKEEENRKKYDGLIAQADKAFDKKDWPASKNLYTQASEILPDESYPKKRLEEIEEQLKKQIADKNKTTILPTLGGNKTNTVASAPTPSVDPDAKYKQSVKYADSYFAQKKYKDAKRYYEEALTHKGGDAYAKIRLLECEKLINADNAQEINQRKKELLAKYPPGVTEETLNYNNVTILQRVLVKDGDVWVYQKKTFNWGGVSYFRDTQPITESIFEQETKK